MDTQKEAHEAIKSVKVSLQDIVLETIRGYGPVGATSDEVLYGMAKFTYGQNSITTRFKELAAKGKIVYSKDTRAGNSGRKQRVMFASEYAPVEPQKLLTFSPIGT